MWPRSRRELTIKEGNHGTEQEGVSQSGSGRRRAGGDAARRSTNCGSVAAEPALSGSGHQDRRPGLRALSPRAREGGENRLGHALERGAGVVRRRPLPFVERHPEQPHHEVGGGNRRGQRVPQALEQRQRQYARPPGKAPHLRARHAARDAHRARRRDQRDRRPLRRQAAQLAERHRMQVGRLDLVHRSAVRHPRQLRRTRRQAGAAAQRLPLGSEVGQARRGGGRCQSAQRPRLLARRIEALHHRGRRDSARGAPLRCGGRRHAASEGARVSHRRARRNAGRLPPGRRREPVDGLAVAIGARAFDVLQALIERCERLVTKEELLDFAWPGLVVEENNLQVQVSSLRKILGPDSIITIPGLGYRFTVPLRPAGSQPFVKPAIAPIDDDAPSIAVLPFTDLSPEKDQEYFADGLAEEVLNVLSKIRGLRVASRTSAFTFKGSKADIPTVAQKLNVTTVLEGSVRKAGKRVRITAQLVEVATDSHLWSETYDRELEDIFAVQDDIAHSVVKGLRSILSGAELQAATRGRGQNAEAHRLYLQ